MSCALTGVDAQRGPCGTCSIDDVIGGLTGIDAQRVGTVHVKVVLTGVGAQRVHTVHVMVESTSIYAQWAHTMGVMVVLTGVDAQRVHTAHGGDASDHVTGCSGPDAGPPRNLEPPQRNLGCVSFEALCGQAVRPRPCRAGTGSLDGVQSPAILAMPLMQTLGSIPTLSCRWCAEYQLGLDCSDPRMQYICAYEKQTVVHHSRMHMFRLLASFDCSGDLYDWC